MNLRPTRPSGQCLQKSPPLYRGNRAKALLPFRVITNSFWVVVEFAATTIRESKSRSGLRVALSALRLCRRLTPNLQILKAVAAATLGSALLWWLRRATSSPFFWDEGGF